ncbi:hypothetical protein [Pseudomonas benzenivorans]|uniref:Uncharacterized protein n=1 Tax=Pseudomonas benzenivorans TaxID=556533 RepID=A0ABY5HF86_9PSED|nr:hypothetical protein [Pseudomonas benzenivorans]UTW09992.1 hypothetical protein KDW96_20840 [Pseudomonas benzenivorans]
MQEQAKGAVADSEHGWPRDFDFREAYAEQRELLAAAPCAALNPTTANGAEYDE